MGAMLNMRTWPLGAELPAKAAAPFDHDERLGTIREEVGQRLAAINLAARAIEQGADHTEAVAVIRMAVSEAMAELREAR